MTESLQDRILRHEGIRLKVYNDSLGFATIGVGRLLSNGISQDEAMLMLDNDIDRCQIQVAKNLPWVLGLDDIRQGVLVEMAFQLGINRLLMFKKALAAMRDHDWGTAAKEMLDSTWHKQSPSRAEELAELMLTGGNSIA